MNDNNKYLLHCVLLHVSEGREAFGQATCFAEEVLQTEDFDYINEVLTTVNPVRDLHDEYNASYEADKKKTKEKDESLKLIPSKESELEQAKTDYEVTKDLARNIIDPLKDISTQNFKTSGIFLI